MNPREHRHESVLTQRLLIQITLDALFGRLLEIIFPQFKPGNLAIPGDNPIYHLDILLHLTIHILGSHFLLLNPFPIRINKSRQLLAIRYDKRLNHQRHIVQFVLNLFRIDILPVRP